MAETKSCSKMLRHNWGKSSCRKKSTVERDGVPYCGIHDPVAVEAKRVKKERKSQNELNRRLRIRDRGRATEAATSAILEIAFTLQRHDKRLVKAFAMLMENSDWVPGVAPAPEKEGGE